RSYIARDRTRYDIIQLSLVDTAAATAAGAYVLAENSLYTVEAWELFAGAYVLAENSLYTVEAWELFLRRLNPEGVLTVTRWFVGKRPGEMYRATALAAAALKRLGVVHPRDHLVIVKTVAPFRLGGIPFAAATILVGKAPFSERDLATLTEVARRMRFDVALAPRTADDATFAALASGRNPDQVGGPLHAN